MGTVEFILSSALHILFYILFITAVAELLQPAYPPMDQWRIPDPGVLCYPAGTVPVRSRSYYIDQQNSPSIGARMLFIIAQVITETCRHNPTAVFVKRAGRARMAAFPIALLLLHTYSSHGIRSKALFVVPLGVIRKLATIRYYPNPHIIISDTITESPHYTFPRCSCTG